MKKKKKESGSNFKGKKGSQVHKILADMQFEGISIYNLLQAKMLPWYLSYKGSTSL